MCIRDRVQGAQPTEAKPSISNGLVSTPCSATYASTSSWVQRAMGEIFTFPRLASQPTTGVPARVGDSSRRSPVAHASYPASPASSGWTLRSAQHRSGSRSCSRGPYWASCSATD